MGSNAPQNRYAVVGLYYTPRLAACFVLINALPGEYFCSHHSVISPLQVMEYVSDVCLLRYRKPKDRAAQVKMLLETAPMFDREPGAAKATVVLSPAKSGKATVGKRKA